MIEDADARMRRLLTGRMDRRLPKRFYKDVAISGDNGILLDGKTVKTPMKAALRLPNRALAEAVASEWQAQRDVINPGLMPITKFANTAIDRAVSERDSVIEELLSYAGSDLVCYRAEGPVVLVALQAQHWDPVIACAAAQWHARFRVTIGLVHVQQDEPAIAAIRTIIAALDPFRLTALYCLATLTGSALVSLMLLQGRLAPDAAWSAAHVDEDYQFTEWGTDAEALARRAVRKAEFDGLAHFLNLVSGA